MKLAVVTATIDLDRAAPFAASWVATSTSPHALYVVYQSPEDRMTGRWRSRDAGKGWTAFGFNIPEILGVVPAFALGVQQALDDGADVIACLHDDLLIEEDGWDTTVLNLFRACPRAGLVGFGGAKGLGSDDIYRAPYNPMQLVRLNFLSNMRHAEAHGQRCEVAVPVAALDGFSLIGRREFWEGFGNPPPLAENQVPATWGNLFGQMAQLGIRHHYYDGFVSTAAKKLGWQVWFLPVKCHHAGGATAVSDTRYHQWADAQRPEGWDGTGDQYFWVRAHQIGYEYGKGILPIRT